MEFKGTTGKWSTEVAISQNRKRIYHIVDVKDRSLISLILSYNPEPVPDEEVAANAQLISKAPEIMERGEPVED